MSRHTNGPVLYVYLWSLTSSIVLQKEDWKWKSKWDTDMTKAYSGEINVATFIHSSKVIDYGFVRKLYQYSLQCQWQLEKGNVFLPNHVQQSKCVCLSMLVQHEVSHLKNFTPGPMTSEAPLAPQEITEDDSCGTKQDNTSSH